LQSLLAHLQKAVVVVVILALQLVRILAAEYLRRMVRALVLQLARVVEREYLQRMAQALVLQLVKKMGLLNLSLRRVVNLGHECCRTFGGLTQGG
jgi:hypothetical protein